MIKFYQYLKGGENMTKEDLNQIAIIVKTEVGGLRDEMNQRFKEQEEKLDKKLDQRFQEQEEKFYRRIDQRISDQMAYFEEKYGRDFALAVECLNSKSETEDIQNQRLSVLEKSNNINSAAIFNHEERINYLEKTLQIQVSK